MAKKSKVKQRGQDFPKTCRMTGGLVASLNHPVRREILRVIHRSGKPMSAVQMSRVIKRGSNDISHHLAVLNELGAVSLKSERPIRGATEKLFTSDVADHSQVVAILTDTEADDLDVRR